MSTSSLKNISEPTEQSIQINEKLPNVYQSNPLSTNTQSEILGHFELMTAEVSISSTKQNDGLVSSILRSETPDHFSTVDPLISLAETNSAVCGLTHTELSPTSSSKENENVNRKQSSKIFQQEKKLNVDIETQLKEDFQMVELNQEFLSESNLAIDESESTQHQAEFEDNPAAPTNQNNFTCATSLLIDSSSDINYVAPCTSEKMCVSEKIPHLDKTFETSTPMPLPHIKESQAEDTPTLSQDAVGFVDVDSQSAASENVQLNQDSVSDEDQSGSDQTFPEEQQESSDENNQMDSSPSGAQDVDVPVTANLDQIDLHASSMDAPESFRFFGFEEILPSKVERLVRRINIFHHSEELVTPVESCETRPSLDSELGLSPPDDEYCIPPGYDEVSKFFDNNSVHDTAASAALELSDTEAYFDCKQGTSDVSETESEEPDLKSELLPLHQKKRQQIFQQNLLLSGSEDYEDSPFTHEHLHRVQEENEESSDEEFTLCEAPPKTTVFEIRTRESDEDETNKSISREIEAELGTLSDSSDEEFLTTRIIRRRVIIKGDEIDDIPPQSVFEETYKDENGCTVVKKITRRVIRKCASSSDGAEPERVSPEAGAQASLGSSEGNAYSKVVKRTVVKSEGDQAEITFTECEGLVKPDGAEAGRVSCVEKTVVLEGERTMTHHGDVTLASDVPSAQEDFRQALGYIGAFNDKELPHVVERQTVKEDGTVVKRAQMCKSRTLRRTTVRGAGQKKKVLLEQMEGTRKGSRSTDLKQHLQQLFHHN